METLDPPRTSTFRAATNALERAIEAEVSGRASHASGTTFVPADLAGSGRLDTYRRLGPVTIVDADGNQTIVPKATSREMIVLALIAGAALWMLARRPRAPA